MKPEEVALRLEFARIKPLVTEAIQRREYLQALTLTTELVPYIHKFLDNVRIFK